MESVNDIYEYPTEQPQKASEDKNMGKDMSEIEKNDSRQSNGSKRRRYRK